MLHTIALRAAVDRPNIEIAATSPTAAQAWFLALTEGTSR